MTDRISDQASIQLPEVVVQVSKDKDAPVLENLPRSATGIGAGMRITIKNLSYVVKSHHNRKEKIHLLKDVSGYLSRGQMTALMGPSGSGKTTLLDVLAGRKTAGTINGEVLFAQTKPTEEFLRRYTGYVEQFDTLLPSLTVYEMLLYTAELKRSRKESIAEKKHEVELVIDQLALATCRNTRIGNQLARGISGGQAKRVNIGISLITNPRVLFLDEPTSGLDSYTANEVMSYVKALVKTGITICATIHSPTQYAFDLFDRLLILLRGELVYFGDNGDAAIDYFKDNFPDVDGIPLGHNQAEWIVDITTKADRMGKASDCAAVYNQSSLKQENMKELDNLSCDECTINPNLLDALKVKRATVTPSWWAFWILIKYRTLKDYTNPEYLGPRIFDKVIFSILIFTLYWGVGSKTGPQDLINGAAVLFMWITLPAFGAAAYTPALVLERPLFIRERSDGLYRVVTYLTFKIVSELFIATLASAFVSWPVWLAVNLMGNFAIFWLAYLVTLSCGIVLAYLVAALSPNMDVANASLPAYVVTLLFFAGFLLRWDDIPNYWIWYGYIDLLRYAWGALMKNQFADVTTPYLNGQTILEYYSLSGINPWAWLAIETCFLVVFFILALLALTFIKHQRR